MSLWLIGAGPHAREYAKILMDMQIAFEVVGRGEKSCLEFEWSTRRRVLRGGVETVLEAFGPPKEAIVAVSYDQLSAVASTLISAGTKRILLEKPGALSLQKIEALHSLAVQHNCQVWVAYNRRFYSSTSCAKDLLLEDGGATSCSFEFTEWSHMIEAMQLPRVTKEAWMIANSSHVADLAFHLCGAPKEWNVWQSGAMKWHSSAARFCGAGVTNRNILFSYVADWDAPGRWRLEVLTRKRRLIFKPLECLQIVRSASLMVEPVSLNDTLDLRFKPGLYRLTEAFLRADTNDLCSLDEQVRMIAVYSRMAGYS